MQAPKIVVVAEMTAKADEVDALRSVIEAAVPPSRAEAGNEVYRLHEDLEAPGHFVMYEVWAEQSALDAHFETPHFKALIEQATPLVNGPLRLVRLRALTD